MTVARASPPTAAMNTAAIMTMRDVIQSMPCLQAWCFDAPIGRLILTAMIRWGTGRWMRLAGARRWPVLPEDEYRCSIAISDTKPTSSAAKAMVALAPSGSRSIWPSQSLENLR